MVERGEHLEKVLHECVEVGTTPGEADPWPAIRERVSERAGARVAVGSRPSRRRPRLFLPRTGAGWAFAALLVGLLATGAYAATGLSYGLFREALPAEEGPQVGEEIGQTETAGGARVTLEYAYADARYVVVGYTVRDLEKDRSIDGRPSQLVPSIDGGLALTLEDGRRLTKPDDAMTFAVAPKEARAPKPQTAVFKVPEGVKPGEEHRFRLEVVLEETGIRRPGEGSVPGGPGPGPFAFGFEVPVRPVPVVEVNKEVEAKGATLTLERVINSPGRPQAVVCVEQPPPGDGWGYFPVLAREDTDDGGSMEDLGGGCASMTLEDTVEGRSSVTVSHLNYLEGEVGEDPIYPSELAGPWTFEFDAPAP